ncbi:filamentous hemagglutinin N-terminal domain-containing protein [Vibrio sp. S17_S38]|uniref:filamentous hemagglutinin N-terminal domain-containing protein n=1 Tax=Vibrio sp. S17_S38 TaxID=2720229 RepID=UPI001681A5EB|nr:filamentous hemagglutinin N-terminal domain-containing protein [Vibrio sp. S17_S38]MBD1572245.1 filamentous hemagglutinin N-terminal domain-containing protein [Vibrio sp. S17_S38]
MNTSFSYSHRVMAYGLCWVLTVQPAMANVQPGNANTQVSQAGNGVPIINIATPNGKGLSHNQYQQFNVDKQGLILNNATDKLTPTQLGGLIQNNLNLKGKAASVILNEVTGANRSQLNGYTEVAGNKANVIVTNQYGITCNGCGFINTSRATLSTGKPQISNGELIGFDVNQGDILINGQGLDATQQDYLDLISRSAKIQANIHANQLNIIAGSNEVDYKTNRIRSTQPSTDNTPKVAIDSSALGGMYAGRIALVSTEKGVGVNVNNLATSVDDIRISSDGKITLGAASAQGNLIVDSNQDIDLSDKQFAKQQVNISGRSIKANNATTVAEKELKVSAIENIDLKQSRLVSGVNANGDVQKNARLIINTEQLSLSESSVTSQKDLISTSHLITVDNKSLITSTDATLNHLESLTNDGAVQISHSLKIQSNSSDTKEMQLLGKGKVAAGKIDVNIGTGNINTSMHSATSTSIQAGSKLLIGTQAKLNANTNLDISADDLFQSGDLQAGDEINIRSKHLTHGGKSQANNIKISSMLVEQAKGEINSRETVNIKSDKVSILGDISANGNVDINSESLLVGGLIQTEGVLTIEAVNQFKNNHAGKLLAKGDLELNAKEINNQGDIKSGKNVIVKANDIENSHQVLAGGNISINAHNIQQDGDLQANQSIVLEVLDTLYNLGKVQSGQYLSIDADSANVENDGLISAGSVLSLTSSQLNNIGQIMSGEDVRLMSEGIINTGGVYAKNNLNVSVSGSSGLYNSGVIKSDKNITVISKDINQLGVIEAQQSLAVTADNIQQKGNILTSGGVALNIKGTLDNSGIINSSGEIDITAQTLVNDKEFLAEKNIKIKTQSVMQKGVIKSEENISIDTDGTLVNEGEIKSTGSLSINSDLLINKNKIQSKNQLMILASSLQQSGEILSVGDSNIEISGGVGNIGDISTSGDIFFIAGDLNNQGQISSLGNTHIVIKNNLTNTSEAIISGGDTFISSLNINNSGQLQALSNLGLSIQNFINSGALVALNKLSVVADSNVKNQGLIYSGNDAIFHIKGKLSNQQADIYIGNNLAIQGRNQGELAQAVDNISGSIEAQGELTIKAEKINNRRINIDMEMESTTSSDIPSKIEKDMPLHEISGTCSEKGSGNQGSSAQICDFRFNGIDETVLVSKEYVKVTAEGESSRLVSNSNMHLDSHDIYNDASLIASNKNLDISANNLFNKSYQEYQKEINAIYQVEGGIIKNVNELFAGTTPVVAYRELDSSTVFGDKYQSSIVTTGTMTLDVKNKVDNGTIGKSAKEQISDSSANVKTTKSIKVDSNSIKGPELSQSSDVTSPNVKMPTLFFPQSNDVPFPKFKLPSNPNGLFIYSPSLKSKYVIETNPVLTNLGSFLGSDYFQSKLGLNLDKRSPFLGDAFYDTRVITQTIFEQTGWRYLHKDVGSDLVQMQQLIDNAALESKEFRLTVGVALTAEQISNLENDILWYETIKVNGQTVLAPKLYLSQATLSNVKNGALIAGEEIAVSAGNINNSGSIDSSGNMTLVSQNAINNNGGLLQTSGNMLLQALNDINNIGAQIKGGNLALISEQGSINNLT